jgi:hypothetical protein
MTTCELFQRKIAMTALMKMGRYLSSLIITLLMSYAASLPTSR